MHIRENIKTNGRLEYTEVSNFVRILDAQHEKLSLEFYRNGALVAKAENIGAGYAESFDSAIDRVVITSEVEQDFSLVMRLGSDVRYDTPPNGNVRITNANGVFNQKKVQVLGQKTVLDENASRRYLMIQNLNNVDPIFVNIAGGNPDSDGLNIEAGGSIEISAYVPTNKINVSGDAYVVVIEG